MPRGSEVEILARGFGWSEGPVWVDQLNAVLFSDVWNNKAYRWDDKNGLSVFLDPSGFTGIVPANKAVVSRLPSNPRPGQHDYNEHIHFIDMGINWI